VRTGLYIPQRAIIEKEFLVTDTTDAWLLLDYLRRWVTCKNVKKIQVRGREFFWIKYAQACRDLPILFSHRPILRTQINKMVRLVASLKKSGLIDTVRLRSRCYIHITEAALELYVKPTTEPDSRFSEHGVTSANGGSDMERYDDLIMRDHDAKEQYKNEQHGKELHYTQNNYSEPQFECVKRHLEMIFPKRSWSNIEIALLRQMPIPMWELTLILRFYQLPIGDFLSGDKLDYIVVPRNP
jgi:hypothetical protein